MKYLIKLVVVVLSALLLNTAAQSKETTFSEKVEKMCGIHPRVELFRQYKDATIKDEFLVHINKCVTGESDISVLNWNITDGDLQGCLIKEYEYQETYVQNIADVYGKLLDSDEIEAQIEPYNACVNSIRKCGKHDCTSPTEDLKVCVENLALKMDIWHDEQTDINREAVNKSRQSCKPIAPSGGSLYHRIHQSMACIHTYSRYVNFNYDKNHLPSTSDVGRVGNGATCNIREWVVMLRKAVR